MSVRETVRDYYEALRRGEPLYPYFAERPDVVKVGVFSRLVGGDAVAEGLREQSRTTDDWTVDSRDLRVTERDDHTRFTDVVDLAWVDTADGASYAFETRWSGVLEPRGDGDEREWVFVDMHVSAPHDRSSTGDHPSDAA
ncbi:nuclear transport factor 2 family protein [Salinigranum sp. GCM10025319]|uniref:nuclear transport factor 2 family protein n=1 Tax=Salinigranum sp. GCM10025319 TaxID=3252687 RepID=UPI003607A2C9